MISKEELRPRIAKFQKYMSDNDCHGAMILQDIDLYYFSGTKQNAWLYIPQSGEPVLFCRRSYARAEKESPWPVIHVSGFKAVPGCMNQTGLPVPERIALEFDVIPVATYDSIRKIFPQAEILDGSKWIRNVRAVKSPAEIDLMRIAGRKMADIFSSVSGVIKPGMTEVNCAREVLKLINESLDEGILHFRGYNQELFYGHLLSGANSAEPSFNDGATGGNGLGPFYPQGSGRKIISRDEPVTLDYVGIYHGYMVDKTRVFVAGRLSAELQRAFNTALDIQRAVIDKARPGVPASELWETAYSIVCAAGLQDHFMGFGQDQAKFAGHGIGLEVDELPVLTAGYKSPLEEGMVFALEPKFVFPGQGMVGIENTWLVAANGMEKLTVWPDDLAVIPG